MINLSEELKKEINNIESDGAYLVLLDINIAGTDIVLNLVRNNENFIFQNKEYTAFPFELPNIKQSSESEIPEIQIQVSNVDRIVQSYVEQANGAGSSLITLYVVNSKYPDEPLIQEMFSIEKTSCKEQYVIFTLSMAYKKSRRPLRRYMKTYCDHLFKGIECGYIGADETCDHTLNCCRNKLNSSRFGGTPLIGGGVYL